MSVTVSDALEEHYFEHCPLYGLYFIYTTFQKSILIPSWSNIIKNVIFAALYSK
jgi:hypothetical protein